jgi:hypothetical protein
MLETRITRMSAKSPLKQPDPAEERGSFWQPPEARRGISDAGRKWQEENAEAIASINEWVEKHGLPLAKYRMW